MTGASTEMCSRREQQMTGSARQGEPDDADMCMGNGVTHVSLKHGDLFVQALDLGLEQPIFAAAEVEGGLDLAVAGLQRSQCPQELLPQSLMKACGICGPLHDTKAGQSLTGKGKKTSASSTRLAVVR